MRALNATPKPRARPGHGPTLLPQGELLCGFDFVVAPLVDPAHQQPALELPPGATAAPATRRELMLASATWGGQVRARAHAHAWG